MNPKSKETSEKRKSKVLIVLKISIPNEMQSVVLNTELEIEWKENESFSDFAIRVVKERMLENPSRRMPLLAEEFEKELRKAVKKEKELRKSS